MEKVIMIFMFFISTSVFYPQNRIISGKVITEHFEITPGVSITINDTVRVGETNLNGVFKVQIPISTKKVLFSAVGHETAILNLTDNCDQVEVILMYSGTYDFMTLRKVNRKRIKLFKKIPSLHKKAFENGLFITEKACYSQEFMKYHADDYD